MNVIIWIAVWSALDAGAGLVAWWFGRARRKRESPLISLVALLLEPVTFDPLVLATVAGRALNADLGDGSSEGEDGFVVCVGIANTIVHQNRHYRINCFTSPYVDDHEAPAESIRDLRIRR